jgi:membrane protease YdiL (CAAX protease family)
VTHRAALAAVLICFAATGGFLCLVALGKRLTKRLPIPESLNPARGLAARLILGSAVGQLVFVACLLALRTRGWLPSGLLGLHREPPNAAWVLAAVFTFVLGGLLLAGPLRGSAVPCEFSASRLGLGFVAGAAAGLGEELLFRAFVFATLATAGLPTTFQLLFSAALFGLAHLGWGRLTDPTQRRRAVAAAGSTAAFGPVYGLLFLFSGRSVLPVKCSHAMVDFLIEPALLERLIGSASSDLGASPNGVA